MKLPALVLLVSCLVVRADTEEHLNKTIAVHSGGTLLLDVETGTVKVTAGEGNDVTVDVLRKIKGSTAEDGEEYLAARPVTIEAEGDSVRIESRAQGKGIAQARRNFRVECLYTITVPMKFNAQIKTGAGAVSVEGLTGDVQARSNGGGLTFARLRGPLQGDTGAGAIRVTDCEGEQRLKSGGGGIEVTGGNGSLNGNTGGGLVSVKEFKGGVQIKSGGGGLTVENVTGPVEGKTGGGGIAVRLSSTPADEIKLTTAGGGVTLKVPEGAAFDLDAATVGGKVSSELPVDGGVNEHGGVKERKPAQNRLKGPVNGGGKSVVIRTGGGGIRVTKA